MDIPVLASRIESVTVHSCGAVVARSAELAPVGGAWPAEVRLTGLPLALEDGSVRVRVEAGPGASAPAAVGLRIGLEAPGGGARPEPPDEKELREARRQVGLLRARCEALGRRAVRMGQLEVPGRPAGEEGKPPPPSPHGARLGLIEFRRERLDRLAAEQRAAEEELRRAEERATDLSDRKRRSSTERTARENELRKTAAVSLRAPAGPAGAPARLVIEYQVPGARWAPAYALRFERDWSRVELGLRAVVAQRTGEDWRGVKLTLSTADLAARTELPEMTSLRIGRRQPPPKSGWRPPPTGAEDIYADYDRVVGARRALAAELIAREFGRAPEPEEESEEVLGALLAQPEEEAFASGGAVPCSAPPPPPAKKELARRRAVRDEAPAAEMVMSSRAPAPSRPAPGARPRGMAFAAGMAAPSAPMEKMADLAEADDDMALSDVACEMAAEPPAEPEPGTDPGEWLDYGRLRMPGPAEGGRGRLARTEPVAGYMAFLASLQVQVKFDVAVVLAGARSAAESLGSLPAAHEFPSTSGGFDYVYRAEPPAEIPSDGQFHSIPLLEREAPSRLSYVTVPREAPEVFRFAELANPLDEPLLSGPADVYAGGDFLMTVPLHLVAPHGKLELGLGVEEALKVARNTTFAEETSGLMGGTLNLRHEIRIELRNLLRAPVEVEVRERLPVAAMGEQDLKVSAGEVAPAWEAWQPEGYELKGGQRWRVKLPPGEAVPLRASYTVILPAKMELDGGNRRER